MHAPTRVPACVCESSVACYLSRLYIYSGREDDAVDDGGRDDGRSSAKSAPTSGWSVVLATLTDGSVSAVALSLLLLEGDGGAPCP